MEKNSPPRKTASWKRIGVIALQLAVTAAGIYFVFHDPAKRTEIGRALRLADWRWLALGWVCYSLVEILATVRWQLLLRIQGISLSWWRACGVVMTGLFFNMFLPGLVGGDAVRLYYVFKKAPQRKTRGTLSVAMDRLFGLFSIVVLAACTLIWRFDWLKGSVATLRITYLALTLLGGAFLFVLALFAIAGFGLLDKIPRSFPFRDAIRESGKALILYGRRGRAMLLAFLLTIVSHLAYYLSFYCAGQSLAHAGGPMPAVADVLSIMPLVNTMTAVPVSFGGVGVRETLFQQLLGDLAHVPPVLAALTATLGFAIQASWSLLGAGAFLLLRKLRGD